MFRRMNKYKVESRESNQELKNKYASVTRYKFFNKRNLILIFVILGLILIETFLANVAIKEYMQNDLATDVASQIEEELNIEPRTIIGDSAIVSSLALTKKTDGVGPFDADNNPGNDSSDSNNIVRSFDQVSYTVEATMAMMDGASETSKNGGTLKVEAVLPESFAGKATWDVDSMGWTDGTSAVSSDGRIFTADYKMNDDEMTVPGKQTLVFILQVNGAQNGDSIVPTFNIWLEGNDDSQKKSLNASATTVSASPRYNIKLERNNDCKNRVSLDYGEGDIWGRIYGYYFILQLYNASPDKGMKGVEVPVGDITFDFDITLQRQAFTSGAPLEDITNECMPILWNYKINNGNEGRNPDYGNIPGRNMYFGNKTAYNIAYAPHGELWDDRTNCVYDSGDIVMTQNGRNLSVTIRNYAFDDIFPIYNVHKGGTINYTDNIGCFSVGYMQLFVPEKSAILVENRNYYLTVADSNFRATSATQTTTTQADTSDDTIRIEHVRYQPGSYTHHQYLYGPEDEFLATDYLHGDSQGVKGQEFKIRIYIAQATTNDGGTEVRSVNKLLKFDGDGVVPILFDSGEKFQAVTNDMTWKAWYVTKTDGTNWASQTERNNADVEDLRLYENLTDIPSNYICVGMYFESQGGILPVPTVNDSQYIVIRMKVKETAQIGDTYGFTQNSMYWLESLDRSVYTITNPNVVWPTPVWQGLHFNYVNTEYDEDGNVIQGTHNGGYIYGQTIAIVGAAQRIEHKIIDDERNYSVNINLGC